MCLLVSEIWNLTKRLSNAESYEKVMTIARKVELIITLMLLKALKYLKPSRFGVNVTCREKFKEINFLDFFFRNGKM